MKKKQKTKERVRRKYMTADEVDKLIEKHLKEIEAEHKEMEEAGFDPDNIKFKGTGNF